MSQSRVQSTWLGLLTAAGLLAQHQADQAIDHAGVGSGAADGDVGHDPDVALADNLHELHDGVALRTQRLDTYPIGFCFGLAGGSNGFGFADGAQPQGFSLASGLLDVRVGSMQNLVDHVLQPIVGNYFRNSAQDYTVLDFLSARSQRQTEAAEHIRIALQAYDVQAIDTLIGDINPPAQLMQTQTDRKIAEEERKTYEVQEAAQKQRQQLVRQTSLADIQHQVVGAEQGVQIAELQARQKTEPQNVDLARRLGALCEQKDDIESAIKWYQCAVELTGSSDAGLIRKLSNLKMRGAERDIAAHEEFLAGHTKQDAAHAKRSEELQAAKKKRAGILIEEVKKRLERNPTDLQLRFELGEHCVNAQRFREAVPELQRARQNPNARLKAMNLLGVCYCELGMLDLAMKQFEDAAREIVTMDPMKKEIVYNLGIVYEKMGEREKSLNCMKQIYEADYSYRDVAERVESSYQQDKGGS